MTMHRPTLTEHPDGIYRPLDRQIEDRLRPVEGKRPGPFKHYGNIAAVFLFSIGVYAGMWVCMIFGPWVIWAVRKMRRNWR